MRFSIVVPIFKELELVPVFVNIHIWMKYSESSPESPMVSFDLPVVLWRIRSIALMFDPEFREELGESWSKLRATIGANRSDTKRSRAYEIVYELHARSNTVLGMKSREHEPTAVIDRIVLNLPPPASERKAGIHLNFSPGFVEYVQSLSFSSPFSSDLVSYSISLENSVYGRLVQNDTLGFDELLPQEYGSEKRVLFGKAHNHSFSNRIGSICGGPAPWSAFPRNHSGFSFDSIASEPFGYRLARHRKNLCHLGNLPFPFDDFFD